MAVSLPNGVLWIAECYPHDDHHEHVGVYLIPHEGSYIAIDSGSVYHREAIREGIEEATDGAGIDAIVLSHSDYPHSGNVSAFRDAWGEVELVASSGAPESQGLTDARHCEIGGETDVLGRRLRFIDPPLADRSHTTWIHDPASKTLFTADGFGAVHRSEECDRLSTHFKDGIDPEAIYDYHRENLVWLRYVDPQKLRATIEGILEGRAVDVIAPVHGHPIVGEDVHSTVDRVIEAAGRISEEYTVPDPPEPSGR